MAEDVRCTIVNARVRSDRAADLQALIRQLFNRRHHDYIASQEKMWLTVELVQSLREQSAVYRTMSSKTEGPLPFALGYFRVRDDRLELVSDTLPGAQPEVIARLLSEFLEPGAQLVFRDGEQMLGWTLRGEDEMDPVAESTLREVSFDATSAASG